MSFCARERRPPALATLISINIHCALCCSSPFLLLPPGTGAESGEAVPPHKHGVVCRMSTRLMITSLLGGPARAPQPVCSAKWFGCKMASLWTGATPVNEPHAHGNMLRSHASVLNSEHESPLVTNDGGIWTDMLYSLYYLKSKIMMAKLLDILNHLFNKEGFLESLRNGTAVLAQWYSVCAACTRS